jgi:hypothetical protein
MAKVGEIERQLLRESTRWAFMAAGITEIPIKEHRTMKPFDARTKLQKKITGLEEEHFELTKKIAAMNRIPGYQPEYSGAKLHNWLQDQERLTEKIGLVQKELADLVNSDAYIDAVEKASGELLSKRAALSVELAKTEAAWRQMEYGAVGDVIGGGDALEIAEQIITLKLHAETLAKAIHYLAVGIEEVRKGCGERQPGPGEPGPWIVDGRGA